MHHTSGRLAFVVNPVSGGKDKARAIRQVREQWGDGAESIGWNGTESEEAFAGRLRAGNYEAVVAMGGDGTVNRIGRVIAGTGIPLGIIPLGSGNGLARHLRIPLDSRKAIDIIRRRNVKVMDSGTVNGTFFLCTCGAGFDALIGQRFAGSRTRGFRTYVRLVLSEYLAYRPEEYELTLDGRTITAKAFLIAFANTSQYGSNARIAPLADEADGLLDVTILKPFGIRHAPGIARQLFGGSLHRSPFAEMHRARDITLRRKAAGPVHYDGEPMEADATLRISIKPSSVKIIVP